MLSLTGLDLVYFKGLFLGSAAFYGAISGFSVFVPLISFYLSIKLVRWTLGCCYGKLAVLYSTSSLAYELWRLDCLNVSAVMVIRYLGGGILDPFFVVTLEFEVAGSSQRPMML